MKKQNNQKISTMASKRLWCINLVMRNRVLRWCCVNVEQSIGTHPWSRVFTCKRRVLLITFWLTTSIEVKSLKWQAILQCSICKRFVVTNHTQTTNNSIDWLMLMIRLKNNIKWQQKNNKNNKTKKQHQPNRIHQI